VRRVKAAFGGGGGGKETRRYVVNVIAAAEAGRLRAMESVGDGLVIDEMPIDLVESITRELNRDVRVSR
jgi:hypothetical protein